MGKLTAKQVEGKLAAGIYQDGEGLRLIVKDSGRKSWALRYQRDGKRREMGLGSFPSVTLKAARAAAADLRKLLEAGKDPMTERDAEREAARLAEAKRVTFETLAADYVEAHSSGWSDNWRRGWQRKLERYVLPVIGKLAANEIRTEHILRALKPIWTDKPRTADEVRSAIERILDAAKARSLREGDNPARWRGHLENLLSKAAKTEARRSQHFAAMPWQEVPAFLHRLLQDGQTDALALAMLILTGARSHMVIGCTWAELDLDAGIWSLSAERMKSRRPFRIPLAPAAVELLKGLPRIEGVEHVFPGGSRAGHLYEKVFFHTMRRFSMEGFTTHGFRSTLRTWLAEQTSAPRVISELILAHDVRGLVEASYDRADYLEARREWLNAWAAHCLRLPAENVITGDFGKARA